ncbi:MAG TPA: ABC transporter substrate-binding protein [Stellaceae bacterium]|nr:ABC transporter substrate-binding protein [Stellaceae bacterium]
MTRALARLAAVLLGAMTAPACAANTVTIGAIYPFARDPAAHAALEVAAEVINTPHDGLAALPLGAGQGLPALGGAKIAVDFADDLDNPSAAEAQALRLAGGGHVAALIGGGGTAATLAAARVAERHRMPFLTPDDAAPSLAGRGFGFVFRLAPLAAGNAKVFAELLGAAKAAGTRVATVALVFEDSAFGHAEAGALRDTLTAAGFATADIAYAGGAADLSAPVAALKERNPDAVIFVSRAADAILFAKTMQNAGYKAPIEIGDDAGFSDPVFVAAVGNLMQGLIGRSVWRLGKPDSPAAIVNGLYKAKTGRDLDAASAQIIEGLLVLADAINRAGSTDSAAIQAALRRTDLKRDQLIVGYDSVAFDASGQNTLAATYLTQLQDKHYVTIWPADQADAKLALPFKGWE